MNTNSAVVQNLVNRRARTRVGGLFYIYLFFFCFLCPLLCVPLRFWKNCSTYRIRCIAYIYNVYFLNPIYRTIFELRFDIIVCTQLLYCNFLTSPKVTLYFLIKQRYSLILSNFSPTLSVMNKALFFKELYAPENYSNMRVNIRCEIYDNNIQ